jgi:hypothetical protein
MSKEKIKNPILRNLNNSVISHIAVLAIVPI